MADENVTTNETPTAEDYAAIKLELEAERQRAQGLVAEATSELTERIATLEADLATKTQETEALKGQLNKANTAHSELVEGSLSKGACGRPGNHILRGIQHQCQPQ